MAVVTLSDDNHHHHHHAGGEGKGGRRIQQRMQSTTCLVREEDDDDPRIVMEDPAALMMSVMDKLEREGIRLVVFDFDHTILKIHSYYERVTIAEVKHRWESDFAHVGLLQQFVDLAAQRNIECGIASYGNPRLILEYMHYALLRSPFNGSNTLGHEPLAFSPTSSSSSSSLSASSGLVAARRLSKTEMLALLRQRSGHKDLAKSQVLLLDDDPTNVSSCRSAGFSAVRCPVKKPSGPGLTHEFWLSFATSPPWSSELD